MDFTTLAFKQLVAEGKAEIIMGIPCYEWNELIDRMIRIQKYFINTRKNCPKCHKSYDVDEDICLHCNAELKEKKVNKE